MKYTTLCILALVGLAFAKERTELVKVIKPDTTIIVKCDTIKTVKFDTLKITKKYKDTSILLGEDTATTKPEVPKTKK